MKKQITFPHTIGLLLCLVQAATAFSQKDSARLEDLSLKELLNVKIISASKTPEFLFDAPLSASVVTKDQLRKAGCTSIPEALRLVPGMIVREQTNGNYDIHLRGMDNVPPNAAFDITSNTTTLVMIDNRPIYSYFKGGTFWETLPVDINDVEKIEVVRGPAAALYGPNAVNGVINIITRQPTKEGVYAVANTKFGSLNTTIANASVGYKADTWSIVASANHQERDRSQTSYFEFWRNREFDNPDYLLGFLGSTANNIKQRYPNPERAMKKSAANFFANYSPAKKISVNISTGFENSEVQRVSAENNLTPLSTASSRSRYIDLRTKLGGFSGQASYISGTQNTDYDPGNKYDFNTLDASLEYNYTIGNLSLKPALSYRSAEFDDRSYNNWQLKQGIFNVSRELITKSASLRSEYKLLAGKLRFVGAAMLSKFNNPDTSYASYELAATYKPTPKNLFRAVFSEAPRSSSMFSTYVDQAVAYVPTGRNRFTKITLNGNKAQKLLTSRMLELGYRGRLSSSLSIDVEAFMIDGKNFSTLSVRNPSQQIVGPDTVLNLPIIVSNLPLKLRQQGLTASIIYHIKKLQISPFVTIQKTEGQNYPVSFVVPPGGPLAIDLFSTMGNKFRLESTPSVFGGMKMNYTLSSRVNINLDSYYYSAQTYRHVSNLTLNDGIRGIDHIPAKLLVNASLSFEPVKRLYFSVTGKNLLNNRTREFFHTDQIPTMFFAGLNYEL